MPDLPNLALFCKQNPTVMVRYQIENFVLNDFDDAFTFIGFLAAGVALTSAVVGDEAVLVAQRALLDSRISMQPLIQEAQH